MARFFKSITESRLFFIILLILIFLGDGKQPLVDVVASAGILCLFIVRIVIDGPVRLRRSAVDVGWCVLLLYLAVHTFFSDSVGYSVSTMLRWVMAYLVFVLFSSGFTKNSREKDYGDTLLLFSFIAVVVSFVATGVSRLGQLLPGMNLLFPNYGHNHIANIVVFAFPVALYRLIQRKNLQHILLFLLLCLTLVFSFARGGWLLVAGYLVYILTVRHKTPLWVKTAGTGVLFIGIVVLFSLPRFSKFLPAEFIQSAIFRDQITKSSIIADRLSYWQQAIIGIRDRPIFGAGPGTFYLLSKRYQLAPSDYSWFAHSFLLEFTSEVGVFGMVLLIILGYLLRGAFVSPNKLSVERGLRDGVMLTLLYSVYEINLNFLVIWFLLWATIGVLFARARQSMREKNNPKSYFVICCVLLLVLFYIYSVTTSFFALFPGVHPYVSYGETYNADLSITGFADTKTVTPQYLNLVQFFHKKNPDVLFVAAQAVQKDNPTLSSRLFFEATSDDPQNVEYFVDFISSLLDRHNTIMVSQVLTKTSEGRIDFFNPELSSLLVKTLFQEVGTPNTKDEYMAKLCYFLGLELVGKDPNQTHKLWVFAKNLSPEWGYYSAETASLDVYILKNPNEAKQILSDCQKNRFTKKFCKVTLDYFGDMPPVGTYRNDIFKIP